MLYLVCSTELLASNARDTPNRTGSKIHIVSIECVGDLALGMETDMIHTINPGHPACRVDQ